MLNSILRFRDCITPLLRGPALPAIILTLLLTPPAAAVAQEGAGEGVFRELVERVEKGETDDVRKELPDLVSKYQNHPGVLYLQARLASDGIEAAKLYQSILDNFPGSEWADDALFHLQQYYYAMGLYKTAELKMQQLKKEYPESKYLSGRKEPLPSVDSGKVRDAATPPAGGTAPGAADTAAAPLPDTAKETAPPPDTTARPAAGAPGGVPPVTPGKSYTVQTGAFSTAENAYTQKDFFDQRGYTVEVANRVRGGRSLYLVWVGSYATSGEAREALREIQEKYNITPIIVER